MGNTTPDTDEFNRRLTEWLIEYNFRRPHQALGYSTPINFIYKRFAVPSVYRCAGLIHFLDEPN
jgi:transposase InsO family protein